MALKKYPLHISPDDIAPTESCKVTICGDSIELTTISHYSDLPHIKKIDKDTYKILRTGEIRTFNHDSARIKSMVQTFSKIRNLINANITSETAQNALWVTLTYAENMTDTNRLYDDFKKFMLRFRYYCMKNSIAPFEYITVVEPQARGAWHHHMLLIWKQPAPYIPNSDIADVWGHGFTKTKALSKSISNIGAYLTAYLTDIDLSADDTQDILSDVTLTPKNSRLKAINGKRFLKGGRIHLYPKNMRIFRHSRGIKQPKIERIDRQSALALVDSLNAELKYKHGFAFYDDVTRYGNEVFKEFFNRSLVSQNREKIRKACRIAQYWRTLYLEMLAFSQSSTEFQEYENPPCISAMIEIENIIKELEKEEKC